MIKISGFSKQQTKLRRASEKLADHLGIKVDVTLRKLKETRDDKYGFAYHFMGQHGVCVFGDCPDDKLPLVIAHEFVHVHQVFRGDMTFNHETGTFWWKGEEYDTTRLESMEYYDRPWEAEARALEVELAKTFFKN